MALVACKVKGHILGRPKGPVKRLKLDDNRATAKLLGVALSTLGYYLTH